ncbi:MAG: tmoS, partial [Verrucomicrobiales bacterium]|nr:tmoS [Verrucomicrobiales bacterium]
AAKYTPEGGNIELRGFREAEDVVLQVSDNGLGLRPDQVKQMFDLFVQGERSLARSEGGLGIGLTIVRRLAELHGGRASAFSEGPDKGSSFSVRLPLASPATASVGRAPGPVSAKQTIMVVDDNIDSAQTLGKLLRISGHTVRVAHTGRDALDGIAAEHPEFIVLDIGLPDLDGFAVATEIRRRNLDPRPRIIALSGYGQASDFQKAEEAGVDHYLMKPLDLAKLKQLLC